MKGKNRKKDYSTFRIISLSLYWVKYHIATGDDKGKVKTGVHQANRGSSCYNNIFCGGFDYGSWGILTQVYIFGGPVLTASLSEAERENWINLIS